ncbi:C39 family peptidase [Ruegeria arenilitoris]|uniref:C39 family peptidase n=1 Tax=Ruegeria arenilitoris TaxID=1173585 RepID=UPI00148131C7|nr:C39 family peptidase [Ruegeria arenilitoris]
MKRTSLLIAFAYLFCASCLSAEISWKYGAVSHNKLPPPQISKSLVRLDVPHIRQGLNLCVPTSAAMVMSYFGNAADPRELKALAEGYKPESRRNADFTYWRDMNHALQSLGYNWKIRDYPKTNSGFASGLKQIKRNLEKGLPVLIDVHQDAGHTFVLIGFDDAKQVVFVRDPNLPGNQSRIISYASLRENWHNHRFGHSRSAFFAYPKK